MNITTIKYQINRQTILKNHQFIILNCAMVVMIKHQQFILLIHTIQTSYHKNTKKKPRTYIIPKYTKFKYQQDLNYTYLTILSLEILKTKETH